MGNSAFQTFTILLNCIFLPLLLGKECAKSEDFSLQLHPEHETSYIPDAPVIYPSLVNPSYYAFATVPLDTVYIAKSGLPKAGLGVFAARQIPKDTYFSPYGGIKHNDSDSAINAGYAWTITDSEQNFLYFVDAYDPNHSNWLRFINCPNNYRQQNIHAVIHLGEIFYITTRDIAPQEELLVYYGDGYADMLGFNRTDASQSD